MLGAALGIPRNAVTSADIRRVRVSDPCTDAIERVLIRDESGDRAAHTQPSELTRAHLAELRDAALAKGAHA